MPLINILKKDKKKAVDKAAAAAVVEAPDGEMPTGTMAEPEVTVETKTGDILTPEEWAARSEEFEDDDPDAPEGHEVRAGGGLRADQDGEEYWLDLDQIREFNRMDRTIKVDTEFWDWFSNARKEWGLRGRGRIKKRGRVTAESWGFGSSSWKPTYLSDMWGAGRWYSAGKNDQTRKLAIALAAVQTTIRVVDSHERRMWVRLASKEDKGRPESFTNYDERVIQVSPMALLDETIKEGDGIDITTGFALHEASHAQHSEATLKDIRQPTVLTPLTVASLLHNILEDVRIEALTSDDFPGFAPYFEKALTYMWGVGKDHLPKMWGPTLPDKLRAIIASTKWHEDFKPIAAADVTLLVESIWWKGWVDRYKDGTTPLRKALVEGIDRLELDPDTKREMEAMRADEKAIAPGSTPEEIRRVVREMMERMKLGLEPCPSHEWGASGTGPASSSKGGKGKPGIGGSEAMEIERLVRSEIEAGTIDDFKIPGMSGGKDPGITILHPVETIDSRKHHKVANPALVQRMKSAFFFRPSVMEWRTRLQRTGAVDEDELYRAGMGDYRVFEQVHTDSVPDTSVTLLIDASGSMMGYAVDTGGGGYYDYRKASRTDLTKVGVAIQLAQIMLSCLRDMNGVKVRVRAHTGDNTDSGGRGVALYKIWDPGDPMSRIALMHQIENSQNWDGYAIGWCVRELLDHGRPGEQRVVIVLSDGHPAASGYGGEPAYRHVKATTKWAANKGVDVIQIAIDPGMDPYRQAAMFDHWIPFESTEKLPQQMTGLLRRIFPGR